MVAAVPALESTAGGRVIKILLDNHNVHTSIETHKYIASVSSRFEFLFAPKLGSWLNLVESFFGKLARCLPVLVSVERQA
jgi:transposase